jgi:extracellular matrix protein 14
MILDIWSMTQSHVDIRLPKTTTKGFLSLLPAHLNQHEPIITNLRAAVDYTYPSERTVLPSLDDLLSRARTESARNKAEDIHYLAELFFANYQSYETVNQWLYLLESLRPELVQVVNLGSSHEGREILGLVIKGPNPAKHAKTGNMEDHGRKTADRPTPGMVLHGAQHAREWISVTTACYIAYEMVAGYYVDESLRKIVDEFDWTYVAHPCIRRMPNPVPHICPCRLRLALPAG